MIYSVCTYSLYEYSSQLLYYCQTITNQLISIHFFGLIVYEAHLLSLSNVSSKFVVNHANGAIVYIPNENSRN